MKRLLIYIGILVVLLAIPVQPLDIGRLRPVEVVSVFAENGYVVLETDTKDRGIGESASQALQNLKDTAPGTIYLDTANYLLIAPSAEDAVEELRQYLKRSVRMCMIKEKIDLQQAVPFLETHGPFPRLGKWQKGEELPVLTTFENF